MQRVIDNKHDSVVLDSNRLELARNERESGLSKRVRISHRDERRHERTEAVNDQQSERNWRQVRRRSIRNVPQRMQQRKRIDDNRNQHSRQQRGRSNSILHLVSANLPRSERAPHECQRASWRKRRVCTIHPNRRPARHCGAHRQRVRDQGRRTARGAV